MTISWNFIDILIISISIGLIFRFKQFNVNLELARDKPFPHHYWNEIRYHYTKLADLVTLADHYVSHITLLSCSNNMFFVCLQLYKIFKKVPFFVNTFYFWFSITFLIGRLVSVLFFSAAINSAARKPLQILRKVPSISWSPETERFTEQILDGCVALSGYGYFSITKRLIFAVCIFKCYV